MADGNTFYTLTLVEYASHNRWQGQSNYTCPEEFRMPHPTIESATAVAYEYMMKNDPRKFCEIKFVEPFKGLDINYLVPLRQITLHRGDRRVGVDAMPVTLGAIEPSDEVKAAAAAYT
jgi:hypothetical protein